MNSLEVWMGIGLVVSIVIIGCLVAWVSDLSRRWGIAEEEVKSWRTAAESYGRQYRDLKKHYAANFGLLDEVIADLQTVKPASYYEQGGDRGTDHDMRGSAANPANQPAG